MRVLFLASDGIAAPVRLRPLLDELRSSGHVEDFACVDRELVIRGARTSFDAVLVHRNPGVRQIAWLRRSGLPFVYDIDDLLLARDAAGLDRRRAREQEAMRWCLAHARCVTSPSRRLLEVLDRRLGGSLGERAVFLPNTGFEPIAPAGGRPRLLWVSSDGRRPAELLKLAPGIAGAGRALETEVVLVGPFAEAERAVFPGCVHVPWVEPAQYGSFLAGSAFIAAAPLPLELPADEQAFVDCKSDIKAAQFCSLGIAALYSPAAPYADSDLPCRLASGNTADSWREGLMELARRFPDEGRALAQHAALAGRRRSAVAQALLACLKQARTAAPFSFRATPTPTLFRRLEQRVRSIRSRLFRR